MQSRTQRRPRNLLRGRSLVFGLSAAALLGVLVLGRAAFLLESRAKSSPGNETGDRKTTEGPPATTPAAVQDLFQAGSSWTGQGRYTFMALPGGAAPEFTCGLSITKRTGNDFRGIYSYRGGSVAFEGSIDKNLGALGKRMMHWKSVSDRPRCALRNPMIADGILAGRELTLEVAQTDPATLNHGQSQRSSSRSRTPRPR